MLDPTTGTISLGQPPFVVSPDFTRKTFLSSTIAAEARTHVENEPYHSWAFDGAFISTDTSFRIVLWFHGEVLSSVTLTNDDPWFGTSWADHSLANEMQRNASHEYWLVACIGQNRTFPWRKVICGYDERGDVAASMCGIGGRENQPMFWTGPRRVENETQGVITESWKRPQDHLEREPVMAPFSHSP